MGGLPCSRGLTKVGALVRADNLTRLDEVGRVNLVAYGVRTVIDVRDAREILRFPYPFPLTALPGVSIRNVPLVSDQNWEAMKDPQLRREGYVLIPKLSLANVVDVLRCIADSPEGTVVVHCNEGRERTGVLVASLLALLGVADDTIAADWVKSAPTTMESSWIIDVLDYMRLNGTIERHLATGGLAPSDVAALRSRLVTG